MASFFFSISCSNFAGGLILSAYLRQFLRILKIWGLVKSESCMSSIYFLYWLISVYLANPLDKTVSMTLKVTDSAFKMLILLPYFIKQPIYDWEIHFVAKICELNLIKGILFRVIYLGIRKLVLVSSKKGSWLEPLYVLLNSEYKDSILSDGFSNGLTDSVFERTISAIWLIFSSETEVALFSSSNFLVSFCKSFNNLKTLLTHVNHSFFAKTV